MSSNISRRSFLKCAGATALAVGAVGLLGGCGVVDDAISNIFQQVGDQTGHAADSVGKFMYGLSNDCRWWHNAENELTLLRINFQVKNLTDETVTFKVEDIKSATIDGHKAKAVLKASDVNNNVDETSYTPLFDENGTKTYGPSQNMNQAEENCLYFTPVYEEGEEHVNADWRTFEMTFTIKGKTSTFVMTHDENNMVTSHRK